jgi:hypothetical protein
MKKNPLENGPINTKFTNSSKFKELPWYMSFPYNNAL